MIELVRTLRGMTDAGTADYTIAGFGYWTDDHLLNIMDRYRVEVYREQLYPIERLLGGGTVAYYVHKSEYRNFEQTTGGTAIFWLETSDGTDVGTASYTMDYQNGNATFTANTSGTTYYLTGRSYDLNRAAADVWRQKAAHYAGMFSFSTDNHRVDKGALIKNAMQMANVYDGFAGPVTCTMNRSDVDVSAIER
jgi:hypothetical protein